ncbi:MAG: PGPGW domain-containing protein [Bryobacteraceae bacterium]|nr:PGPGW domain-containing protein [Bryobacteraceae bacterium]
MTAILRIAGGFALVLLGIAGIILPVMPGWVFLIPGLMILADYFPWAKRLLDWVKAQYEKVRQKTTAGDSATMDQNPETPHHADPHQCARRAPAQSEKHQR